MPDPRHQYAPALPDTGHVMASLAELHLKVDTLNRVMLTLLRSLADEIDPDVEDLKTLEGRPAGQERDTTKSL